MYLIVSVFDDNDLLFTVPESMQCMRLHCTRCSIGSFSCSIGKSDYRPLAGKANQQMTDANVFNRGSLKWLLLVSVAVDISMRYFMN